MPLVIPAVLDPANLYEAMAATVDEELLFQAIACADSARTIVLIFALPEVVPGPSRHAVIADLDALAERIPGATKRARIGLLSHVALSPRSTEEILEWWRAMANPRALKLGADTAGHDGMASIARLELGAQEEARANPHQDCFVVVDGRVVARHVPRLVGAVPLQRLGLEG